MTLIFFLLSSSFSLSPHCAPFISWGSLFRQILLPLGQINGSAPSESHNASFSCGRKEKKGGHGRVRAKVFTPFLHHHLSDSTTPTRQRKKKTPGRKRKIWRNRVKSSIGKQAKGIYRVQFKLSSTDSICCIMANP